MIVIGSITRFSDQTLIPAHPAQGPAESAAYIRLPSITGNPAGWSITNMDNNRSAGAKHEIKGALKELAGKITGNESKELAGNVEQKLGKVQRKAGEAADEIRDAAKKDD